MLKNKEFNFLNVKLVKLSEKVRNIDRGGCGIFAVELAIRLKKIKIPCKLVIIDYSVENYMEDIEEQGYVSPEAQKPTHVMLKVGRKYIDSNGVFTKSQMNEEFGHRYKIEINHEQFIDAAKTSYGWNSAFKRSSLPIIKKQLTATCKDLNKLCGKKGKKKARS